MILFKRFYKEEDGQGLIEYALLIGLIALIIISGLTLMSERVRSLFTNSAIQQAS